MTAPAGTQVIRKASIEELCGHRDRALQLYAQVADLLFQARTAHRRAIVGPTYVSYVELNELRYPDMEWSAQKTASFVRHAQRTIDKDMWRALVDYTGLGAAMDAEERKRFNDELDKHNAEIPEVTPETVEATLLRLAGDAPMMFRRGLVKIYQQLSGDYHSHDGFKMGSRIVLSWAVRLNPPFGGRLEKDAEILDIDRVMHLLDNKPFKREFNYGLAGAIRTAMEKAENTAETPYFRARWFHNRNLHLWLLREDLVALANQIIAEEGGAAIGAAPKARKRR